MKGIPSGMDPRLDMTLVHFVPALTPEGPALEYPDVRRRAWGALFDSLLHSLAVNQALKNVRYIGPLRQRIPPFSLTGTQSYSELGPTGADVMRVLASQACVGSSGKTTVGQLSEALRRRFRMLRGVRLTRIDPDRTFTSLVGDEAGGLAGQNLAYMGFGIGQLVPVVVETMMLPPNGCLLVEQPEVHLHPAAQADLGNLLCEHIAKGRRFDSRCSSSHTC